MGLVVECRRGRVVEAVHPVSAVAVDADGRVLHQVGEDLTTTWRSGAKPLQLEVSAGHVTTPLRVWDLAIGASSHSGQQVHIARVKDLLERVGCTEGDLYCGAHRPVHQDSADALVRARQEPSALHNNCSGKHTFMAGACRRHGWPADYRDPDHPLQRRIKASVDTHCGVRTEVVVDGCGVPCFVLPISAMARGYARLAAASEGLLSRIAAAMSEHPQLVSGEGRDDAALAMSASRPIVAKVGAMGLMNVAIPSAGGAASVRGIGVVVKVHSGDGDARAVATASVLGRWFPGLVPDQAVAPWKVVTNHVGRVVGERVAIWDR